MSFERRIYIKIKSDTTDSLCCIWISQILRLLSVNILFQMFHLRVKEIVCVSLRSNPLGEYVPKKQHRAD